MSRDETRNVDETLWVSVLPPELRRRLETPHDDAEAAAWEALVAADRALDDDLPGSARTSRVIGTLAAAGIVAVIALTVHGADRSEQATAGGGSRAVSSGSVTAGAELAERNRVVLASSVVPSGEASVSEPSAAGGKGGEDGGASPKDPSAPPSGDPRTGGPGSEDPGSESPDAPLASVKLPVVGEVTVPQPDLEALQLAPVELPPVELPSVQLPQLPSLLPPGQ